MIIYNYYQSNIEIPSHLENKIVSFLHQHLVPYGDAMHDIQKAVDYARGRNQSPGGALITALQNHRIVGAVVLNKTGMTGYIPENILVYIATHKEYRGKGIGKKLMQMAVNHTPGNIALHVEPENPAKRLYEKLGFTHKYLEMRLNK